MSFGEGQDYERGRTALQNGKYQEAARLLELVIEKDPVTPGPRLDLARAYNGLKRYQDAMEQLRQYVRLAPPGPERDEVQKLLEQAEKGLN